MPWLPSSIFHPYRLLPNLELLLGECDVGEHGWFLSLCLEQAMLFGGAGDRAEAERFLQAVGDIQG